MVNVNVEISGIVQNCDESLLSIQFGNGYSLEKIYFDELTFQGKIVDGYGRIDVQYSNSRMYDNEKLYFICLKKHDNFQILGLQLPKSDNPRATDLHSLLCACPDGVRQSGAIRRRRW